MILKEGKIPNSILKEVILNKICKTRDEILIRPGIGEDCGAFNLNGDTCVITTDPITGSINNIGDLAINIVCNDLASSGAEPIGVLITLLLPVGTSLEDLKSIAKDLNKSALENNVEIIGGHTEVTAAVNRVLISTTGFGKVGTHNLIVTKGAKENDFLVMTKEAGLEGTAIIASENEIELTKTFGIEFVVKAKNYINLISVVKEGLIAAENGASAMHDATEGGILGAAWEMASSSNIGLEIFERKIPIRSETKKICEEYDIDPLKLISSGSMLIGCKNGEELVNILGKNNISSAVIGVFKGKDIKLIKNNGYTITINEPESDEIYKVLK